MGIAQKAGYIEYGEDTVTTAVSAGKVRLIVMASDAGEHTRRKIRASSERSGVICLDIPVTKNELGLAVGKGGTGVVAITDIGIAASFAEKLAQDGKEYAEAYAQLREKADKIRKRKKETEAHRRNVKTAKRRV